jgi:3-oxoacyl-[acyl-carrier-protein] synthase II
MRIAVTGMGCISPLGITADEFSAGLLAGEVGIRRAPWLADDDPSQQLYGTVHERFDPRQWMDDKVIAGTDGFAQMALGACAEALAQAGLEDDLDPLRTGVVGGSQMGGSHSLALAQSLYETQGVDAVDPKVVIKMYPNMAASQICMRYGLHGPSLTVATTCATSLDAIGLATRLVASGAVDVVITGGFDGMYPQGSNYVPATAMIGVRYGMDTTATDPRRAMLPFDVDRAGIVGAEGAACFVLESEEHARARGAQVLAWVRGYGSLADAYHPSSPDPSGQWERRAMELAQAAAGIAPGDVDALLAHATGTPKGDDAEIKAINDLFVGAGRDSPLVVSGIKGNTGHTGSAAGAMAVVAGVRAMGDGRLPHVAGTTNLDGAVRFDVVLHEPRTIDIDVLQVNAFGFGGQNASVVLTHD